MQTTDSQDEIFIVVNRKDHIIDHRTRYECHHDKSLIHRTVGVLVYNREGQLLLQKRSRTKDLNPGQWAISSSGHVTRGQSYKQAALRELQEELGITAEIQFVKKWLMETSQETEMGTIYRTRYEGPFKPNPEEVERVEFFRISDISRLAGSGKLKLSECTVLTLVKLGILPEGDY